MIDFYWACNGVSTEILKAIAIGLRLKNPDFFTKSHSGLSNRMCTPLLLSAMLIGA